MFGNYDRFIPYYCQSISKSYPDSDIIVFYDKKLDEKILNLQKTYNLKIYENYIKSKDLERINDSKLKGGALKLYRHLLPQEKFVNYDYVFFGDVDILILGEQISLFDFHIKQMNKNGLPFSNKVRLEKNGLISNRLTGLHFVDVKNYFPKIEKIKKSFLNDKHIRKKILENVTRDEHFLYNLNKFAFDFDEYQISKNKRPWHGFHLGLVRGKDFLNLQTIKENSSLSIEQLKQELSLLNKNSEINDLLKKFYCREVYFTYKSLGLNLPFWIKLYYDSRQLKSELVKKLRKLKNSL